MLCNNLISSFYPGYLINHKTTENFQQPFLWDRLNFSISPSLRAAFGVFHNILLHSGSFATDSVVD